MIRLLANYRSKLSIIGKTFNHGYVNAVIPSIAAWEARDADLNPVSVGLFWGTERASHPCDRRTSVVVAKTSYGEAIILVGRPSVCFLDIWPNTEKRSL